MNKKWKKFVTASLIFALLLSNAIGTTILPNDSRNIVVSAASDEETVSDKYKELYAQAQSLSESDYTADSWNAFNAVWSALMPLSDISGFAEETQTNVYNRLKAAIDGLVPVDNTDTEKSVNEKYKELYAQAQSLSESDYTANSWNAFNAVWSALMPLSDISGFAEATQTNVYNRLKTAIDGLVPSDDNDIEIEDLSSVNWNDKYIELREVALKLDESDYTAESWAAFNNVWSRIGQYVNINGFLETTQIKFFYQLRTAMDNLDVVDGDITSTAQKYIHLYAIANVLKESNYTSDSWNVFNTVWSELSVNKNISKLTADEQDKVYNRLVLAIDQLVPNESYYQEFLDLFDEAENLDNSKYTDDSWKDFSEA
ncbi:MAG: hypothetical protein IJ192_06130, partial [Clostridia bacterium]|nr:hypothetical protein [Clostridia bacterium]